MHTSQVAQMNAGPDKKIPQPRQLSSLQEAMRIDKYTFAQLTSFLRVCMRGLIDGSKSWAQLVNDDIIERYLKRVLRRTDFFELHYEPSTWPIIYYVRRNWLPKKHGSWRKQNEVMDATAHPKLDHRGLRLSPGFRQGLSQNAAQTVVGGHTPHANFTSKATTSKARHMLTKRGLGDAVETETEHSTITPPPAPNKHVEPASTVALQTHSVSEATSVDKFEKFLGTLSPNLTALHSRFVTKGVRCEDDFCGLLELPVGERELFLNKDMALSAYEFRRTMTSLLPDTLNPATLTSRRFRPENIPDLSGRVAIVSGGSTGIGYFDALYLAKANAHVIIISANVEHGASAEAELNQALQESDSIGSVKWYACDFERLKDVDALAKQLAGSLERLDILICNAGIGQSPFGLTADGLERHFEVNNLAHYVLVLRLLPVMKKTVEAAPPTSVRIVMQSSEMHRVAPSSTRFLSKDEINQDGDGSQLYGRTKLGLIYFARELAKRKFADLPPDRPILALSVHPGAVDTDIQKQWAESYGALGKVLEVITRKMGKSAPEGAEASLWAATSTDIFEGNWKDFQGRYYNEAYGEPGKETSQAQDERLADNWWELCANFTAELLGEELR
ncbi:hypothetical protein CERSUDRAFT_121610 [Gelatoporia subvermispora B]|uniref:NAD(P)-binding protein n=1 Tax=Ceriporiopsis subvermispora (strain B) TaxID=914234 RepID=M2PW47_CERS8|nr:hypothetical protein CERSUDRAFT_121610 [Gelatoporia subvermispora B]